MPQIYLFNRYDRLSSNCYVLMNGSEYCVIDPSISMDTIMKKIGSTIPPSFVLLTHEHIDHLWEIESYHNSGVKIFCSAICAKNMINPEINCSTRIGIKCDLPSLDFIEVKDNAVIALGDETLRVIETKGHSAGSVSYLGSSYCFTGDTLFAEGGYGRYDLLGSDLSELKESLNKLLNLAGDTVIYPGHGNNSTISETKSFFNI